MEILDTMHIQTFLSLMHARRMERVRRGLEGGGGEGDLGKILYGETVFVERFLNLYVMLLIRSFLPETWNNLKKRYFTFPTYTACQKVFEIFIQKSLKL